jgi:YidC/Oxa1 family membrane protein insertase
MKFMTANKVNPAKGCLPILPQIPVFVALYNVLNQSIELRLAPFMGWIQDLSAHDPYYVTPLLLGACMFLQQKLTPTTGMDKAQQRMLLMMPVIFTAMMISLPSGLVLYMLTNSIISIMQQQWLNKKLGMITAPVVSPA